MTSPENKPSNDSSVIKDASSTANYSDKKVVLTDADDSSVLDSTVEHTEPSKSSETHDDNDCGEDMACAQPPETTIAIKSIGADEVVATLETAKPNNESEITGLETPLPNESLKSTTAPNHKNLENASAEHAQEEDNASEQNSQKDADADAEITVEAEDIAPADAQSTYPISDNPQQESKANSDNTKPVSYTHLTLPTILRV